MDDGSDLSLAGAAAKLPMYYERLFTPPSLKQHTHTDTVYNSLVTQLANGSWMDSNQAGARVAG